MNYATCVNICIIYSNYALCDTQNLECEAQTVVRERKEAKETKRTKICKQN